MNEEQKEKQKKALYDFADGKPVKSEQNKLRKIEIRVTPEEYDHIKLLSEVTHLSMSEFIRRICSGVKLKAIPPELFYDVLDQLYSARDTMFDVYGSEECLERAVEQMSEIIQNFKEIVKTFYGGTNGVNYRSYVKSFNEQFMLTPEQLKDWEDDYAAWQEMRANGDNKNLEN